MVLDSVVKQRINNARDILVGKVPDPKAQIEQITIALIYKFMDDMEKKLGSNIYFKNELEEYSWDKVFNEQDSAIFFEKYTTAIDLFSKSEHFPYFFREIFKNAYVPYKDSRTLKLFLNEISYFDYEHSEKLGDAFEYLLSVMSSQGDAGQFRTPRHIIDFIVEVLEPKINERILDPACGTAGFLISAVKFMEEKAGGKLNQIEVKNIRDNLYGFDISPNMVRLGLVNMFLHGFYDSNIEEFDTLSNDSKDKWDMRYDVILANPPFMTPKGGVEPHDLLLTACDSKRAEVLFTHYIATHLKSDRGRAGIIVPEGIIFQSGKAYRKLRKDLLDNGLFAVVSLPSGIFNPYSGVKTSILFIDKSFQSDDVVFVKVENDGYHLGAQRRKIDKNDLPEAKEMLLAYRHTKERVENSISHFVSKSVIYENEEYNLSGERYKSVDEYEGEYPLVELGEVAEVKRGSSITKKTIKEGNIPVIAGGRQPAYFHNESNREGEIITISGSGAYSGFVAYHKNPIFASDCFTIKSNDEYKISTLYIYNLLKVKQSEIYNLQSGGGQPHVYPKDLIPYKIPLPPLDVQQKIVEKIEKYQNIIDGAKQVVENYSPQIEIDKNWEMKELGEVCEINPKKSEIKDLSPDLKVSFVPMSELGIKDMYFAHKEEKLLSEVYSGYTYFKENDVLLARVTPCFENGKSGIAKNLTNQIGFGSSEYFVFRPNEKIKSEWIYYLISNSEFLNLGKNNMSGTGGLQRVTKDFTNLFKIPLPPLETQEEIVKQIEKEQELVNNNKQLIEMFEKKIEDEINKVWNRAE
ncbi:MAG: N-6 DNA methylase [Nanoarchaeota archaeon]|nr:N-6 DNA methylase [Nanoarchaeota archaeon]